MKKMLILFSLLLGTMASTAFASEGIPVRNPDQPAVKTESVATEQQEQLDYAKLPSDKFVGTISLEEMDKNLQEGKLDDVLYLKHDAETVLVFKYLAKDKASCTQMLYALPKKHIYEVYSNNQVTSNTFYKVINEYKGDKKNIDGYKTAGAKSPKQLLANGGEVHKFWFELVKAEHRQIRFGRRGLGLPIGIGMNIPIGHGRHRPRIGIGL